MMISNPILRRMIFILGLISVGVGVIGVFLPLLPTTPFLLLSAWCFYKSSPKTHAWLLNHKLLGPPLRDWQNDRAIAVKTKILAMLMIGTSLFFIWRGVNTVWVKYAVTTLLTIVSIFILTRKNKA
jgi:uncharacterized membrane protein YbaN (DUF454 family)